MKSKPIEGETRTLGVAQGYEPLHIRDDLITVGTITFPVMVSEWELTDEELGRLNTGGRLRIAVLGERHPPILPEVV